MKHLIWILVASLGLYSCAGKSTDTDGKKNKKPVISAFEGGTPEQKNSKAAADVLDSPRFVPSEQPVAAPVQAPVDEKGTPKEVIKSYTNELQTLKDDATLKGDKREKQISEKVRRFFDFDGLSRLSLGTNWNQLSPKKQKEFTDLFTRLIEKSYLRKSKNLVGSYQLSYGDEKVAGDKATVACEIYKDDVDLDIIYELHKVSGTWMIYNIVFDQVNLAKNYQTQFNQIITKSKIDGLMDMMRKKLKENSSEVENAM